VTEAREMESDGRELIFVVSQPRSGSTLLQHILGSHPDVHTSPEPWLLLPLVYTRRAAGITSEFNQRRAADAIDGLLDSVPDGRSLYEAGVRDLALSVYREAILKSGKRYFLDKTPRYYLIVEELRKLFPAAHIVLLFRNPLAVLSSLLEVADGDWSELARPDRRADIFSAPRMLLGALDTRDDRLTTVHYENLVSDPAAETTRLCSRIGIEYTGDMLRYSKTLDFRHSDFGDPKVYQHASPVALPDAAWLSRFNTPQKRHVAISYLQTLGPETMRRLGYSYEENMKQLVKLGPQRRSFLVPWTAVVTPLEETPRWKRLLLSVGRSLSRVGVMETLRRYAGRPSRGYKTQKGSE
jgi:Sulfotransferase family